MGGRKRQNFEIQAPFLQLLVCIFNKCFSCRLTTLQNSPVELSDMLGALICLQHLSTFHLVLIFHALQTNLSNISEKVFEMKVKVLQFRKSGK